MQKLAFYILYSQTYTDHDLVTVWLMSRDYSEGVFDQLFYYGQPYNLALDAWLAAPLVRLGMDPVFAPGIVCFILSTLAPILFWCYTYRQQKTEIGILYLLVHCVAPFTFLYQYASGLALAVHLCTILVLFYFWKPSPFRLFATLLIATFLALGIKNALAILMWFAVLSLPTRKAENRTYQSLAWTSGITFGALLFWGFSSMALSENTFTHSSRLTQFGMVYFWQSLQHFFQLFWGLGPLWNWLGIIYFFSIVALTVYFIRQKQYNIALANTAFVFITLLTLFTEKSLDGKFNAYFPYVRFFLAIIPILGLSALYLPKIRFGKQLSRTLFAMSTVSLLWFFYGLNSTLLRHKKANSVTGITPVRTIVNMAKRPELMVLWQSGKPCVSLDHACLMYAAPAIFPGAKTLFLPYDRRAKKYADFYYSELKEIYVINEKIPLPNTTIAGYTITPIVSRDLFVYHITGQGMRAGEWMQQAGWEFQQILD